MSPMFSQGSTGIAIGTAARMIATWPPGGRSTAMAIACRMNAAAAEVTPISMAITIELTLPSCKLLRRRPCADVCLFGRVARRFGRLGGRGSAGDKPDRAVKPGE